MCRPQPDQVGLPQVGQVMRAHMVGSFLTRRIGEFRRWRANDGGVVGAEEAWPSLRRGARRSVLEDQRPKSREKNPPRSAFAASICARVCLPSHHSDAGTLISTIATC
jgi:hypothetical protein